MAENKTRPTQADVLEFLNSVDNDTRREDAFRMLEIMKEITGDDPVMWGPSIVGFGSYHYKYDTGREGDMCLTGFSPRKTSLTVYIMPGFDRYGELMSKLGKHKSGKSCLYINKLSNVDEEVLKELISEGVKYMRAKYHS